jgi:hypothetical protein
MSRHVVSDRSPTTIHHLADNITTSRLWQLATDALAPQDSSALAEDLGIEMDTNEHLALERSALFNVKARDAVGKSAPLKRKREPES